MKSAVVVLYFNKIKLTRDCINSILKQGIGHSHIFAFSNGSKKEFHNHLKKEFNSLNHLHSEINRGFSGGFNESLKWVFSKGFDSVLFLTNDTILGNNAIKSMEKTFDLTGSGLIAPTIRYHRNQHQIDSCGAFFDRERVTLSHYHSTEVPLYLDNTDYIPGTALFITKEVFKKTGGMDEAYHTYWDDADFSFRAHGMGVKQARDFGALIYHKVGKTCHKKPIYTTYYFQRNRVLFCRRFLKGKDLDRALRIILRDTGKMLNDAIKENNIVKEKYLKEIIGIIG